jgi:hypothetical protein
MLRHPIATGVVTLGAIAIMTDGLAQLDQDEHLGTWVGFVAVAFMVYSAVLAWFFPRIGHRSSRDVLEVSIAAAISASAFGWVGRDLGASKGVLYAGAVESAILVVVLLARATRTRTPS